MKLVVASSAVLLLLTGSAQARHTEDREFRHPHAKVNLDPLDNLDEAAFEKYFGLDPVEDAAEFARREQALADNEAEIKKINAEFVEGEVSWFDAVNEFADLPADEFLEEKTGAVMPGNATTYGRGLLMPTKEQEVDERSERYFAKVRMDRTSVPSSYSSVAQGYVPAIRNQGQCGSCVAFASMACVEVCFKKLTGVFGDYSEQQLVDCGYRQEGANGCKGAPPHAYLTWAANTRLKLTSEASYPYLNTSPRLSCPANLPVFDQGAQISNSYYTYSGDEELMKRLVYEHGAVVAGVKSQGPFQQYRGGIFAGCPSNQQPDHAIAVVGYGSENGVKYWLIKNSWGPGWGENGYIRLKRGVGMCGIGQSITTVSCSPSNGPSPTNPPTNPPRPCRDNFVNCPQLAWSQCWQPYIAQNCPRSCGLCY